MSEIRKYLKEVRPPEMKHWRNEKESLAIRIIEEFSESNMQMAEIDLTGYPNPEPKKDSTAKSTKQDSFASSFYAWKKKPSTKDRLAEKGIDILLIRRADKIALKKKELSH
jgi:hypothetical protein